MCQRMHLCLWDPVWPRAPSQTHGRQPATKVSLVSFLRDCYEARSLLLCALWAITWIQLAWFCTEKTWCEPQTLQSLVPIDMEIPVLRCSLLVSMGSVLSGPSRSHWTPMCHIYRLIHKSCAVFALWIVTSALSTRVFYSCDCSALSSMTGLGI